MVQVTVKSIRVYDNSVKVIINEMIDGYAEVNGVITRTTVDNVVLNKKYLMGMIVEHVDLGDMYIAKNVAKGEFGAFQFIALLKDAELEIERTEFAEGDEYQVDDEVRVHEHDGFNTSVVGIKVTKKVNDKLEGMIDSAF